MEYGAKWQDDPEAKAAFRRAVARLTVATACLSGVFAALNAGLTTLHATGVVDLGDWPRLLLVVSSLAAGALFDLRGRSYMNIGMTCAAILSTLSFFVLIIDGNGGNELAASIIFYLARAFSWCSLPQNSPPSRSMRAGHIFGRAWVASSTTCARCS